MRKKHLDILKNRVLKGDLLWLLRQGWNLASVPMSYWAKKPMNGPIFGGLVVTYRCNETCPMCNVYKLGDKVREMSTEEWLDVVDQFAELKVSGISLTGGEPMVRHDILEIIGQIKQHNIPVSMSTNGVLLRKPDRAKELLESGIDSIAVSIDGATAEEHDTSRGVKGAYQLTLDAIEALLLARKQLHLQDKVFITIASVINNQNYGNFESIVCKAKEMGVDNVSLNPVQNTYVFHTEGRPDDLLFDQNNEATHKIPETLKRIKKEHKIVDSSEAYINTLSDFFIGKPLPMRCYAPYFSLYVDCFKDILPCGGYYYETRKVMSLEGRRLSDLWRSQDYQTIRNDLRDCRSCYFSCMAELNLNYAKFP